jgi:hypothetical protein
VRRLLPSRRPSIGGWCFADHFGPVGPGAMQVPPHPHIGLQTVTWLLEGEILHLDSLGTRQPIRPGQVNWMTAGRGIAHAEEAGSSGPTHGVQLWVALPDAHRRTEPAFDHLPSVPSADVDHGRVSLLVGAIAGLRAEARTFSPLLGAQLALDGTGPVELATDPGYEHGVLVVRGEARIEGTPLAPGSLLYLGRERTRIRFEADRPATLMLLGGAPFEEPLLMFWNFVARTEDELRDAIRWWEAGDVVVPGASHPRLHAPPLDPH